MNPITTERDKLARSVEKAVRELVPGSDPTVDLEPPRRPELGDYATNVAFTSAKIMRKPPQEIADQIVTRLNNDPAVQALQVVGTSVGGFINFRMSPASWQGVVAHILAQGSEYGQRPKSGEPISLEFGSANPTGPLVVVQGRALSIGATLANVLRFAGHEVFTEWIINDAGSQLDTLGRSLYARYRQLWDPAFPFPDDGYPGDYLIPIAESIRERDGERWIAANESEWLPYFSKTGRDTIVSEQQAVCARFGATFDLWQSERELHDSGAVSAGIEALSARGLTYEQDGALLVRTTEFGDDKDRVIIRSDGRPTYYAGDVAYHYAKFARGDRVIDVMGPDHHGYISRLKAIAAAFGYPGKLDVLIAQQITLMRGDELVSMSKRAGNIVTLAEIIDEVGVDAARFFFVMLSPEQPLTFDLALAKKRSDDNPVFYVQYGHARIASLVRRALERHGAQFVERARKGEGLARLDHPAELALIRRLAELGDVVEGAAKALAPHRLTKYARDVAAEFHQFYTVCVVLGDDEALSIARLGLAIAAQTVLAQVLGLIGVSSPESM
ncbi:MAG TPA: arginine--tRNA ligase [Candidatus Binatia bacterium]|nr:arginine--tRNA ligase [Candidatus Binatia bacterium]